MDWSILLNKHKYKFAFIFFLAYLALTMYKIGDNSLWYDECFSIDLGNDSVREIIHYSWYNDTNPPLYIIFIHFWLKIFGDSETTLRSFSAIAGSLACGFFFLFNLRYFNWQAAVFGTLLFFSSNEIYYYSEEGRTYGLILLLTILSNFSFMALITKPTFSASILLGLFNAMIFYSHTLACINFLGQILLGLILGFDWDRFKNKASEEKVFLGYRFIFIKWYFISWLVFLILFLPWQERFFGIIDEGAKGFWLQKPTFNEYKQVLFDFYNSKVLFYLFFGVALALMLTFFFIKKSRNENFNFKLLIIPIVLGPVLFNIDYFAAYITPIFLKRYVLYTILGFILISAYLISCLNINFIYKITVVLGLSVFSFLNMSIPRPEVWDYNDGVKFLSSFKGPKVLITTDNLMLFSYYFDRKGAFIEYQPEREAIMKRSNIIQPAGNNWPLKKNLNSYTDIYFTHSFDQYYDPESKVEKALHEKCFWVEDTSFKGLLISHFVTKAISHEMLKEIKQKITSNNDWMNQIKSKAVENNISVDSMLTVDAIWDFETNTLPKRIVKKW